MRSMFVKLFFWFWLAMTLSGVVFFLLAFNLRPAPLHGERVARFEAEQRKVFSDALYLFGRGAAASWEKDHDASLLTLGPGAPGAPSAFLFAADGAPLSAAVPPRVRDAVRAANSAGTASGTPRAPLAGESDVVSVRIVSASGRTYLAAAERRRGGPGHPPSMPFPFPPDFWVRFGISFVVGGLVCYGLAWHLTTPVRRLRAATQSLATGDLGARVQAAARRSGDELSDLGHDFNRMAERIERLVDSHRQLVRDVSHELRSPLARLNVALELARKAATPSAGAALDRIEHESERLNGLIGELLTLSRLEGGGNAIARKECELGALIEEVVRDADFETQGSTRAVRYRGSAPAVVEGDRELLRRALENVVRNAIRYTKEETEVEVSLRQEGGKAIVRVLDHGPGVPEGVLAEIFKPFYRVAESRDRRSGGTGIGLAIAERTVTLHGGGISARNAAGGGLEVEIVLPLRGEG